MQFSSRSDIEAPVNFVFAALSDFEAWERAALRRGAQVTRTDALRAPGVGMGWHVAFRFRGKDRDLDIRLAEREPASKLAFAGKGRLLEGDVSVDLMALTPKRTRMILRSDIRPLTLAARLFLQSVRLAKAKVQTRLDQRVGDFSADLESRYAALRLS